MRQKSIFDASRSQYSQYLRNCGVIIKFQNTYFYSLGADSSKLPNYLHLKLEPCFIFTLDPLKCPVPELF